MKTQAPSQNDIIANLLASKPGRWISMIELGKAAGAWAVHSRVAELRKRRGMQISNRREIVDGKVHSFYRYTPAH